jgi:predicted DNA-binding transcriptional regulator YafY
MNSLSSSQVTIKSVTVSENPNHKNIKVNGEEIKAEILCKNSAIGVLIDRFGTDVTILKKDEAHSRVFVKVADNKLFIHWIMAMGDNFKIIGPENLVKEVHDELNRLAKQYEHTD